MRLVASLLAAVSLFACAKATFEDDAGGDTPPAEAGIDGSACPQFDLMTDPKHCGSCTRSCNLDQVCSMGTCKAQCDPPLTKCAADGGAGCVDIKTDPNHCGQCPTKCQVSDGGGIPPGTQNPDPSIFGDGGYDGGVGWTTGTPGCTNGGCVTSCMNGFTACSDTVCYDTKNHHENCGMCGTACAQNEWCTQGNCCAVGSQWCTNACANVLTDKNNCGKCGTVCPMNAPNCISGTCSSAYTYSEQFTTLQTPTTQCNKWKTYIAGLGNSYSGMRMTGSNDQVGITCTDPMVVNAMAQALKNVTNYTATCNGRVWSNCNRYNDELWIDPPSQCSGSNCPNPGYMMRVCFPGYQYGGVKTATCSPPSQTMTLSFF